MRWQWSYVFLALTHRYASVATQINVHVSLQDNTMRPTNTYVSTEITIIDSNNDLSPVQYQAITWSDLSSIVLFHNDFFP